MVKYTEIVNVEVGDLGWIQVDVGSSYVWCVVEVIGKQFRKGDLRLEVNLIGSDNTCFWVSIIYKKRVS